MRKILCFFGFHRWTYLTATGYRYRHCQICDKEIEKYIPNKVRDTLATSERNCVELILAEKDDDCVAFLPEEIVKNLQKIKAGLQIVIQQYDAAYQAAQRHSVTPGDKKAFALFVTQNKQMWTAPFFNMWDGKSNNMKEFIQSNRKNGTWGDSFLDKLLEMSKKFGA